MKLRVDSPAKLEQLDYWFENEVLWLRREFHRRILYAHDRAVYNLSDAEGVKLGLNHFLKPMSPTWL